VQGGLTIEDAYRKWGDDLTRYAAVLVGPASAGDIVNEAFASVVAREASWAAVGNQRAYLHRSVLNAAMMSSRSRGRRHDREMRWMAQPPTGELIGDPAVRAALDRLSPQQRAVTFLTYWLDLPVGDVAAMLDVTEGSVKRQLARSRSTLRTVLS
jgi:RNA polymerase sigma-70 factor (ECF subfamily)